MRLLVHHNIGQDFLFLCGLNGIPNGILMTLSDSIDIAAHNNAKLNAYNTANFK